MKDSVRSIVAAVLAIFAVAIAAATIQSTVRPESSGSQGPGGGGGSGVGPPPSSGSPPGELLQLPFLTEILTVLVVLVALAVLVYLYKYWRIALKALIALTVVVGVLILLMTVLGSSGTPSRLPVMEPGYEGASGGGGGAESTEQPSLPAIVLLLVLVAALLGTIVAYRKTAAPEDEPETDETEQSTVDTAAVGEAAGRAADRLENEATVDNEVYRAWREMTELLDMSDPETSTPDEFATAAVAAGMSRDDVHELTRLFEDVRYGNADPSAEREQQAIGIFRRIEDQYTEDEP